MGLNAVKNGYVTLSAEADAFFLFSFFSFFLVKCMNLIYRKIVLACNILYGSFEITGKISTETASLPHL